MRNHESEEDYLESILVLSTKLPVVRSIDVATDLGYRKSSVSVAMKNLREKEYICVSDAGYITLTEKGRSLAEMIYERHTTLTNFLIHLGVDSKTAEEDACHMEHTMTKDTFAALKKHIDTVMASK